MSPPAHRPRSPAPSSITTATAGSVSKRSSAASMPSDISYVIALIAFGRFNRMIPAEPSRRTIRSPSVAVTAADAVIAHRPLSFPLPLREREKSAAPSSRTLDHLTRHDQPHDLVGAFQNLMHPQVAHDLFDAVLAQVTVTAMQLQRLVGDLETDIGTEALGHRAQHRGIGVLAVERGGGAPDKGPGRLELGRHVGDAK